MAKHKFRPTWDGGQSAIENARANLPSAAERFFLAGRAVTDSRASLREIHQFRLELKRFRYSLELFRPCYGPGLKQRLDALKEIQDLLGDINDCETTRGMLRRPSSRRMEGLEPFRDYLTGRVEEDRARFIRHWRETFDAPGQERWWTAYLIRSGGSRNPR
jgi:CHAD domain-containing protein